MTLVWLYFDKVLTHEASGSSCKKKKYSHENIFIDNIIIINIQNQIYNYQKNCKKLIVRKFWKILEKFFEC